MMRSAALSYRVRQVIHSVDVTRTIRICSQIRWFSSSSVNDVTASTSNTVKNAKKKPRQKKPKREEELMTKLTPSELGDWVVFSYQVTLKDGTLLDHSKRRLAKIGGIYSLPKISQILSGLSIGDDFKAEFLPQDRRIEHNPNLVVTHSVPKGYYQENGVGCGDFLYYSAVDVAAKIQEDRPDADLAQLGEEQTVCGRLAKFEIGETEDMLTVDFNFPYNMDPFIVQGKLLHNYGPAEIKEQLMQEMLLTPDMMSQAAVDEYMRVEEVEQAIDELTELMHASLKQAARRGFKNKKRVSAVKVTQDQPENIESSEMKAFASV
jgi:hypothetical protein